MNQKDNYINRLEVEGYLYAALLSSGLNHNKIKNILQGLDELENIAIDKDFLDRMEDDLK